MENDLIIEESIGESFEENVEGTEMNEVAKSIMEKKASSAKKSHCREFGKGARNWVSITCKFNKSGS